MKFNQRTLQILKNFAGINPSLFFKEGNVLSTIAPSRQILSKAKIDQNFDKSFAIYDLSRFLSTLSLFSEPEITVNDKTLIIKENNKKVNYTLTESELIVIPPNKQIEMEEYVTLDITFEQLQETLKYLSVLSLPEVVISGENGGLYLKAASVDNTTADVFSTKIGDTDKKFSLVILGQNLKLLNDSYKVTISSKGVSHWSGSDIEYWIMGEAKSTFE